MYVIVNNYKIDTKDKYFVSIVKEEIKNALTDMLIKMVRKDRVLRKLLKTHDYFKDKILTNFVTECCDFSKIIPLAEKMTNEYLKFLEEWEELHGKAFKINPIPPYLWVRTNFDDYNLLHSAIPDLDTFICWCKRKHIDVIEDKKEIINILVFDGEDFDFEF